MLTMATCAGSAPHERLQALHRTREEELAKAHEHVRASRWAFARTSMVVERHELQQDEEDDEDLDWEEDWGEDSPATSEPSTPDWRGVSRARACLRGLEAARVRMCASLVSQCTANSSHDLTCPWRCADQFDKILDEDSERAKMKRDR